MRSVGLCIVLCVLLVASAGCRAEQEEASAEKPRLPPCLEMLQGDWRYGSWRLEVRDAIATVRGPEFYEVDTIAVMRCTPPEAALLVRGMSGTVKVDGETLSVDGGLLGRVRFERLPSD